MNWIGNFFFCVGTLTITGSVALITYLCLQSILDRISVGLRLWLYKLVAVLYLVPIVYPIMRLSRWQQMQGSWVYEGEFGLGMSNSTEKVFQLIGVIWLVGLVIGILYRAVQYDRLKRMMRHNISLKPGVWKTMLERADWQVRLGHVSVCTNEQVLSPMVTGLFRPVIILPVREYETEKQRYMVMEHELMHVRRHDLWWKQIVLLVTWLHWFNPLVYLLLKWITVEQEIECDIAICQTTAHYLAKEYAQFLLSFGEDTHSSMFNSTLFESKNTLRRRIEELKKGETVKKQSLGGMS